MILETCNISTFIITNECIVADDKMINGKTDILNTWADHFETLGTPYDNV